MNNCSSHVDTDYYSSKYGIDSLDNKKEAIEHYIKKGKQSGYFPNRETELFYCRVINFDPDYYKRKYSLHDNNNKSLIRHWKLYGHKKGYFVNRCEEIGEHAHFLCNCKIKNKSIYKMFTNIDTESYATQLTEQSTEQSTEQLTENESIDSAKRWGFNCDSDHDNYRFNIHCNNRNTDTMSSTISETITDSISNTMTTNITDSSRDTGSNHSNLSSECPSVPNSNDFSSLQSHSESQHSSGSDSTCQCSECENMIDQKKRKENLFFDAKKTRLNIQHIQINKPSNMENKKIELNIIGVDDSRKKNTLKQLQKQDVLNLQKQNVLSKDLSKDLQKDLSKDLQKDLSKDLSKRGKQFIQKTEPRSIVISDNDSFSTDYVDNLYQMTTKRTEPLSNVSNIPNNKIDPKELIVCNDIINEKCESKIDQTIVPIKVYQPMTQLQSVNDTNVCIDVEEKIARDEVRLYKLQENIKNYTSTNPEPYIVVSEKAIFDSHMEIICQNIINIKNYLNMCQIHLDTYIIIFKQAYQCVSNICNSGSNYIVYNAARIKLCNMLKEAENIARTSYYNDLPIFYTKKKGDAKSPSVIKFPLLVSISDSVNGILARTIGEDHVYFKIRLMKVSVKCLKLDKYCYPALNKGDKITSNTSPIPPCDHPVGKIPERQMYTDQDLIKCWDMSYHLKLFENAMYKITMTKEILNNYSKLIEIKEELCYKIKLANLKK